MFIATLTLPAHGISLLVNGIENKTIEDNITLLLNSTDLMSQHSLDAFWQKQIRDAVAQAVEPYGYYESTVEAELIDTKLHLNIALGEPLTITSLNREILGEGRDNPGFHEVFYNYPQSIGDVLSQPDYSAFKTRMFNYALTNGFFDFTWQISSIDIVRSSHSASILLIAESGPQYYFGELIFNGDDKAKELITRICPFKVGDKYDAALVTQFNRSLNSMGYFQHVIARPVVESAKDYQVPIEITLSHKPRDNFNVGLGVSTDTGLRVPFTWRRPWVNSKGHSILTEAFISEREQEITSLYQIPLDNINSDYATLNLSYSFLDDSDQSTKSETLILSGHRFWHKPASNWRYETSLSYHTENFTQGTANPTTTDLLLPGLSVNYTNSKGDIGQRTGLFASASLQVANQSVFSDIDILKTEISGKWIQGFNRHRLYLRGQLGLIETPDFSQVPSTFRFFTGGDQTVRGFEFQTVSSGEFVTNDDGDTLFLPEGGRYLTSGSIEYAYAINERWRLAVFADAGAAVNDFDEGIARSAGIGAHWLTIVGPIRFYLAFGRNPIENDNTVRLHFILGPEI
nr:outer membrane protein assembly factor [Alteromonas sp. 5E99-2]